MEKKILMGEQIDRSMQIYSTYRQALNKIVTDLQTQINLEILLRKIGPLNEKVMLI